MAGAVINVNNALGVRNWDIAHQYNQQQLMVTLQAIQTAASAVNTAVNVATSGAGAVSSVAGAVNTMVNTATAVLPPAQNVREVLRDGLNRLNENERNRARVRVPTRQYFGFDKKPLFNYSKYNKGRGGGYLSYTKLYQKRGKTYLKKL